MIVVNKMNLPSKLVNHSIQMPSFDTVFKEVKFHMGICTILLFFTCVIFFFMSHVF